MLKAHKNLALFAVVTLWSCALSTGKQGTLGFSFYASDTIFSSSLEQSIATGEEVELLVFAPKDASGKENFLVVNNERKLKSGKSEPVTIKKASTSNPSVLEVVAIKDTHVRLRGIRAGVSELSVASERGSDVVQIRVADLGHIEIDHWAWKTDKAVGPSQTVLLRGGVVHFTLRRVSDQGVPLVGYQVSDAVSVSPSNAATRSEGREETGHVRFRIGEAPRVTITPKTGTSLTLDAVDAQAITTMRMQLVPTQSASLNVGVGALFHVVAKTADKRRVLALGDVVVMISRTPEVCAVSDLSALAGDGLFALKTKNPGECRVVATLARHTAELSVQVLSPER